MHDLRVLREHINVLREGMRRRGKLDTLSGQIDRAEGLERDRRSTIQALEERKAARNAITQEVAKRKRSGENANALIAEGRGMGEETARLEAELAAIEGGLEAILLEVPNVTLPEVPNGDETCNQIVKSWGTPRDSAGVKPHWEIGESLGLIDLERGAKISGSGFIVYRRAGARLVRSLMNYFLDTHADQHGYEETWVPILVNRQSMIGTSQLPKFEDDMYALKDDDMFLIPTAEVSITNLHGQEILDGTTLPRGFVGYSSCFRREAGSAGKDTRGILRVHEFDKVELVWYATPEQSPEIHERMTRHAETILERLGLPYRRVLLASGDTGFASAKTYDLEAWAPGVGAWLEVSSCSTFTEFQARRANIRYRPAPKEKPRFIHTLNGSGLAFPRVIACILEHYQNPDGTVTVPEVLRPLMGTDTLR